MYCLNTAWLKQAVHKRQMRGAHAVHAHVCLLLRMGCGKGHDAVRPELKKECLQKHCVMTVLWRKLYQACVVRPR